MATQTPLPPNLTALMRMMELAPPMVIENPQYGFNGYLLRCKAPASENGHDTIILREPTNPDPIYAQLSDIPSDRLALRKTWFKLTEKGNYACINADMKQDASFPMYLQLFPKDPKTLEKLFSVILGLCQKQLPSYQVFAAVCHYKQLVEENNRIVGQRPPHFHILMKAYKRRTNDELNSLIYRT